MARCYDESTVELYVPPGNDDKRPPEPQNRPAGQQQHFTRMGYEGETATSTVFLAVTASSLTARPIYAPWMRWPHRAPAAPRRGGAAGLHRQDPQRRQACRSGRRAAD